MSDKQKEKRELRKGLELIPQKRQELSKMSSKLHKKAIELIKETDSPEDRIDLFNYLYNNYEGSNIDTIVESYIKNKYIDSDE